MSIQIGDTVRFHAKELKRIFTQEPIRVSPEGIVTGIERKDGYTFISVDWSEPNIPELVNALNLIRVNQRSR